MKLFNRKNKDKEEKPLKRVEFAKLVADIVNGSVWVNGSLMKQVPFILLVVLLLLIYINNRFLYESELRTNTRLKTELHNVKYRSLTLSKDLLILGRRSTVQRKLGESGSHLQESLKPVIVVD